MTLASDWILLYASKHLSVPEGWSGRVMTAVPPKLWTSSAMSWLSVATTTLSSAFFTWLYTRWITVISPSMASGLPGKRVELYLAGMIAMKSVLFIGLVSELSLKWGFKVSELL